MAINTLPVANGTVLDAATVNVMGRYLGMGNNISATSTTTSTIVDTITISGGAGVLAAGDIIIVEGMATTTVAGGGEFYVSPILSDGTNDYGIAVMKIMAAGTGYFKAVFMKYTQGTTGWSGIMHGAETGDPSGYQNATSSGGTTDIWATMDRIRLKAYWSTGTNTAKITWYAYIIPCGS